jgi:hypothetical protein
MGRIMMKLQWRDAYSINHIVAWPGSTHDTLTRPLPTNEIIRSVTTRPLWSNTADSAHLTFVEVGLFEKDTTHVGGVYQPRLDTNFIFVVNKRTMERPKTIDSTSVRGHLLDSLSGTRFIKVQLNLPHPDTTQLNYVHVREIYPDSTPLFHAPNTWRHTLDTAILVDSAFTLLLGPGRASLLQITYLPPDSSVARATLRRNGQRKSVYTGLRYYSVFERDSNGTSKIYYRRSYKMRGDSIGSVLWEPIEYEISQDPGGPTRTDHRDPSLTLRIVHGDTIVTIVWDVHSSLPGIGSQMREIVLRRFHHNGDSLVRTPIPPIESVAGVDGYNSLLWGTPVVSSLSEGEVISYTDSTIGLLARFRDTATGLYSPPIIIDTGVVAASGVYWVQYPTMPTFTQIREKDSSCGISWQKTVWPPGSNQYQIYYTRLVYNPSILPPFPCGGFCLDPDGIVLISTGPTTHNHYHPSLDMHLDTWGGILEGLTWETIEKGEVIYDPKTQTSYTLPDIVRINFKPLVTVIDSIAAAVGGRVATLPTQTYYTLFKHFLDTLTGATPQYYPNTASLNTRWDFTTQNEKALFSVVYADNNSASPMMQQDKIWYAEQFVWPAPLDYTFGGRFPNTSAVWSRRADWLPDTTWADPIYGDIVGNWRGERYDRPLRRPMVLYQNYEGSDTVVRTTRQYLYAKTRPGGYMATGRDLLLPINDSLQTGISLRLHDVWMATDSTGIGLGMIARDTTQRKTDSLVQVVPLLRTENFTASDSVQIGFEVAGEFFGDSAIAGSASVGCYVELIDSTSGSVVAILDSFVVSNAQSLYHFWREPVVDLLTGTYYVRLRVEPYSMPETGITAWSSRYPVDELSGWVKNPPLGKLRRVGVTTGSQARLTAQPNPSTGATQLRFSIPKRDFISVTVYDGMGREVAHPLVRGIMDAGRFAIDFDATTLQSGTYVIELRTSDERIVEKFVVVR